MTWMIEFSRPAVRALRALSREEQRRIAERIRQVEASGPGPGPTPGAPVEIAAGGQALVCVVDVEERRVVVVTV